MRAPGRVGVVTIPVVVHVVHNPASPAENISKAQIDSQIDVLNQDFRATNPDRVGVPSVWTNLIADCEIEFKLAETDPDGNPTDGVTRTATDKTAFVADDDDVKSSATGGADAWPSDDYLNIWVCGDLRDGSNNQILGYAQFPGGPPETDGVVIANTCFGTTGTAAAPFHLGRTATHEIGHWLSLRHIWGDDGSGCGGNDLVDDTPNQARQNFGKPTFPHVIMQQRPQRRHVHELHGLHRRRRDVHVHDRPIHADVRVPGGPAGFVPRRCGWASRSRFPRPSSSVPQWAETARRRHRAEVVTGRRGIGFGRR